MPDQAAPGAADQELFRRIVDSSAVATAVFTGPAHRFLYVNAAYCRAAELTAEELIGRAAVEVFPALARTGGLATMDAVRATGRALSRRAVPVRLRPGAPLTRWDLDHLPLRDGQGQVAGVVLQAREVTSHVAARGAAEAARATLDALFRFIPEGLVLADAPDGRIRRVSQHVLRLAGPPRQPPEGARAGEPWPVLHPDGVTPAAPEELPLLRAIRTGETVQHETWVMQRADGSTMPLLCSAGPIRDAHGAITGAVLAWRDITELQATEAALAQSEARFRAVAEAMPHLLWETDAGGVTAYANGRWRGVTGLGTAMAQPGGWLQALHPADAPRVQAAWQQAVASGGEFQIDARFSVPDGDGWRWFRVQGAPVGAGRLVVTGTDIEDRTQAEAALRDALAARELLMREADHRIKNSLQLVAGLLRLQAGRMQEPSAREALEQAVARVQAIAEAHRALQNSADLRQIGLEHMLRDVAASAAALHPEAELVVEAPAQLVLDAERAIPLALVLSELVTNALKHAFGDAVGRVVLSAVVERGMLCTTVADNGTGMTLQQDGGSLGSVVVRSLSKQIGAVLDLESAPGEGTRVTLTLPLVADRPGG